MLAASDPVATAVAFDDVTGRVLCHLLTSLGRVWGLGLAIVALDGFEFVTVPGVDDPTVEALASLRTQREELRDECAMLWAGYLGLSASVGRTSGCELLAETVARLVAVFGAAGGAHPFAVHAKEEMAREILELAGEMLTTDVAAESAGAHERKVS